MLFIFHSGEVSFLAAVKNFSAVKHPKDEDPPLGFARKNFFTDKESHGKNHDRKNKKKKNVFQKRAEKEKERHGKELAFIDKSLLRSENGKNFHIQPAIMLKIVEKAASPAPAPRILRASDQMF